MKSDKPYPTIEDTEEYVDCIISKFLPGYLKRHREDIIAAIMSLMESTPEEAPFDKRLWDICWAAETALDILAEGLLKEETESPHKAANSSPVDTADQYEI